MSKTTLRKLAELIPDQRNANLGTQFGTHLLEESLRKLGAGRSILIDRNNRIIAGNKTTESAAAIGLENVRIIDSDGSEIIAVRRTDIDLDSPVGRELAIADNRVGQINLKFDDDVLRSLSVEHEIDLSAWGFDLAEPSGEDLVDFPKGKPATMKITFESVEQLQKAEIVIQELLDRQFPGAFFSVSAGEI